MLTRKNTCNQVGWESSESDVFKELYCVKSVEIRSFFWSVFSRIRESAENTFYAVWIVIDVLNQFSQLMIILFIDHTAQNMKFSIRDFFSKCDQIRLRKFTEEIFHGKLHFLCSVKKLYLNQPVFEQDAWFTFCHVCRTLDKTTLMLFFSWTVLKHYQV